MERSINIAAIAVVAHHSLEEWHASLVDRAPDWLKTNGASGVDIVFVINGFIMVYLIFACVLALSSLRGAVVGSTLSILALLMVALALPEGHARGFLANPITLEFRLGLALGWLVLAKPQLLARLVKFSWPFAVGICLLSIAPIVVAHADTSGLNWWPRVFAWGLPAAHLLAAALLVTDRVSLPARLSILLGGASYSLYLTHAFVMISYAKLLKTTALGTVDQAFIVPLVILIAVAVAGAVHLLVERPLLTATRSLIRRPARLPGMETAHPA